MKNFAIEATLATNIQFQMPVCVGLIVQGCILHFACELTTLVVKGAARVLCTLSRSNYSCVGREWDWGGVGVGYVIQVMFIMSNVDPRLSW